MAKKSHKDVEFFVADKEAVRTFAEAAQNAIAESASTGQPVTIDVVVWSRAGAKWWAGDEGVEQYKDDPEASVFERIVVQAQSQGRIP